MDEDLSTDARPLAPRLRIERLLRDIADGSAWEPTRGGRCSGRRGRRSTTGTDDDAARPESPIACRAAPRVGRRGVGPERVGALAADWQFFPSARALQHSIRVADGPPS